MSNQLHKLFEDLIRNQISFFKDKVDMNFMINVFEDSIKMLKGLNVSPVTCIGCLEEQPNQLAHMDYGGCMYDECVNLV